MLITRDTVADQLGAYLGGKLVFDFLKAPKLEAALRREVGPEEFRSQLTSLVFLVRGCGRIAVKEVNESGNESTGAMELT
jgi:hypothetical protein